MMGNVGRMIRNLVTGTPLVIEAEALAHCQVVYLLSDGTWIYKTDRNWMLERDYQQAR